MKARKILIYLPVLLFFFVVRGFSEGTLTAPLQLPSKEVIASMTKEQKEDLILQMKERVEEIKAIDKTTLSKEEKQELRMELKSMKKEARAVTGVYISIGALIIIILLLIIIL